MTHDVDGEPYELALDAEPGATVLRPMPDVRAPFPWFGGKRRVARLVWERFGDAMTYNEPFAGSLAVLLGRPHAPRVETVNDLDCYLANFWRALQHDPEAVAYHADGPVNEADLHARHRWLVEVARPTAERVMSEPEFFDVKIAGWWVWGQCLWIGSGWCATNHRGAGDNPYEASKRPKLRERGTDGVAYARFDRNGRGTVHQKRRPQLTADQGVITRHANGADVDRIAGWDVRPDLSSANGRGGVLTAGGRRWQGGGERGGGSGVHAVGLHKQKPALNGDYGATGHGIHASGFDLRTGGLYAYMHQLAARLRRVRVCCGDWRRVLTPSVTTYIGITAVFLDPPYQHDLRERCYSEDHDISADVRAWALEHGGDPKMRIALCGYEDEHKDHMPPTWECVAWKAHGGYSRSARGKANRDKERIWFSPHCLQPGLFGAGGLA